jgi:hypothetical protein
LPQKKSPQFARDAYSKGLPNKWRHPLRLKPHQAAAYALFLGVSSLAGCQCSRDPGAAGGDTTDAGTGGILDADGGLVSSSSSGQMGSSSSTSSSTGGATVVFENPANNGTRITGTVAVNETLNFRVSVTDTAAPLPQNGQFSVTPPGGTASHLQGNFAVTGATTARASLAYLFNALGDWTVAYDYTGANAQVAHAQLLVTVSQTQVRITGPGNNSVHLDQAVDANTGVNFRGTITDAATVLPQNILWTFTPVGGPAQTSQGVVTGSGLTVQTSFNVASVGSAGNATIALQYTSASGPVSVSLVVPVLAPGAPTINLTQPLNNGTAAALPVALNATVDFVARVQDPAAIVTNNLQWTLTPPTGTVQTSQGGFTPRGGNNRGDATFSAALNSLGTWHVQVTYTNAASLSATASISIEVVTLPPPVVEILGPPNGLTFAVNRDITFDGRGTNPQGLPLGNNQLSWSANPDGPLGTGRQVTHRFTAAGTQTITLTGTDNAGATATASITITLATGQPPVVSISEPQNGGDPRCPTDPLRLRCQATTPAGQVLTCSWTDSISGSLGSGNDIMSNAGPLAPGPHTITATVTDPATGLSATDSATFTVDPNAC